MNTGLTAYHPPRLAMKHSSLLYLLLPVCLSACVTKSPLPDHYLLEPLAVSTAPTQTVTDKIRVVTLSSVHIPHYADRPQIVTATRNNQYQVDELNRWAERLDDNIVRVLRQNLANLLPETLILRNESRRNLTDAVRLSVDILDILTDETGTARLVTQWTLTRQHEILKTRQSSYRVEASGQTVAARVGAINEALNRLSRDIANDMAQGEW